MERRRFMQAAAIGSSVAGASALAQGQERQRQGQGQRQRQRQQDGPVRQYYELRVYSLKDDRQEKLVEDYLKKAAIPAWNQARMKPVGVFKEMEPSEDGLRRIYVLIPYLGMQQFVNVPARIAAGARYKKAGAPYLTAPRTEPAYERIESSLMVAFESIPQIEVPAGAAENKPRIFEMRRYESSTEEAGKKKVEMFDTAEIDVFRKTGLTPVFFGESLIGPVRPNLTYMLVFDDMEHREKQWGEFRVHPEWIELKGREEYKKTVSNITQTFLVPTSYSQI